MGNALISFRARAFIFLILLTTTTLAAVNAFPEAKKLLSPSHQKYYSYHPSRTVLLASDTPSEGPPAKAVPILMYHGVVRNREPGLGNSSLSDFVAQMEALKLAGYTTISIEEFDLFRQGKLVLPPKPIIITFDDGRRDSFYTTDDILRKLGFKATIFVSTGPAIDNNTFYLTWDELKAMKASGRWEIESHGRRSHEKIPVSLDQAIEGRFLTSRMYLADQNRLETAEEFEKRVEEDYLNNINDLKTHVGIVPRYYSIPLNDYGEGTYSNHPASFAFNESLTKKYYRLGFVQANSPLAPTRIARSFYNFPYGNPYEVKRLEVSNLTADQLLNLLKEEAPSEPQLKLAGDEFRNASFNPSNFSGRILYRPEGLFLSALEPGRNGQIIFGKDHWQNYRVTATLERQAGRSIELVFYFIDSRNFLSFGRTDRGFFLQSTVNGVIKDLVELSDQGSGPMILTASVKDGRIEGLINGKTVFSGVASPLPSGAVGFRAWGDAEAGAGVLRSLSVEKN